MTGGFLVSTFLVGIVYAKAGYFVDFILVLRVLSFNLVLRAVIIEKTTAAKWHKVSRLNDPNIIV